MVYNFKKEIKVGCPNPNCADGAIARRKGEHDRDDICESCGVLVRVPANFSEPVSMFTVQIGKGPKKPIFRRLTLMKTSLASFI